MTVPETRPGAVPVMTVAGPVPSDGLGLTLTHEHLRNDVRKAVKPATDPALAPEGRQLVSVLAPVPNLTRGRLDWDRIGPRYAEELVHVVASRSGLRAHTADILHVVTPADWRRQGLLAGSPFSLAHTFAQTGPFRPANLPRMTDNVVLAGCGTVPGVGVPTALLSGRLAADRVTGAAPATTTLDLKARSR